MKNNNETTQMNDNRIQSLDEYKTSHHTYSQKTEDTSMPIRNHSLAHKNAGRGHKLKAKPPAMLSIKNLVKTYENGHQAIKDV